MCNVLVVPKTISLTFKNDGNSRAQLFVLRNATYGAENGRDDATGHGGLPNLRVCIRNTK